MVFLKESLLVGIGNYGTKFVCETSPTIYRLVVGLLPKKKLVSAKRKYYGSNHNVLFSDVF